MREFYKRILVLGNGGAGKSTFSVAMGEKLSLPVVHLDQLWWLPGWVTRSEAEFDALLAAELQKPAWVMDGNYHRTLSVRLAAADAAVFLDIPAAVCAQSAAARAEEYCGRTRPDMAEGCPERLDGEFARWIGAFEDEVRPQMLSLLEGSGKKFFVFSSRAAAYEWLESLKAERAFP